MSIYQSAVKKPITTALIYVAIAIFGIFSIAQIPIDLLPDIETNSIMVMTTYEGASASDIENNVTKPLENTLNSVSDLKHITSQSKENISIITLEFEYGIDIDVATNDIRFIEGSKYGMFNVAGKLNVAVAHNGFTSLFTTIDVEKLRNRTKVVKEYLENVLYDNNAATIILSTIQ